MATRKQARKAGAGKARRKTAPRRRPAARAARPKRKQPESLRLRSAGPGFTVNDIDRSLAWYRDVLGFTVGERWEHEGKLAGVELRAGSVSFWISQDDWKKGRERVKGEGFRMYCQTAQDVNQLAARIRARGGPLLEEPYDAPWGGRAFGVADPDGFKMTISKA